MPITFDDYQEQAQATVVYPRQIAIAYLALGATGEAGEIANKVKKAYRDFGGIVGDEQKAALADEIGDVLWYLAMLCTELGITLDAVAANNLHKLAKRADKGTLHGEGDKR